MKDVFIGAFNCSVSNMSNSSSGAGTKVQCEIIKVLANNSTSLESLILQEEKTWPYGDFFIKGKRIGDIVFLPMVNLFILKKLFFSLYVFIYLSVNNHRRVFFYNTSSFMNIFMFFLKLFKKKQLKILIIQDLHVPKSLRLISIYRLDKIIEYYSYKLTKYSFDYFVPITKQLGCHLELPKERTFPFLGGSVLNFNDEKKQINENKIAVFAGALEKYNGVDYLLDCWVKSDIQMEINIFGSGSLSAYVESLSKKNNKIIFHGFKPPDLVNDYIKSASVNFCLRYSRDIDEEFFFPSKFFDVIGSPGIVVCNNFMNIPHDLKKYIYFVKNDLSDLSLIVSNVCSLSSFHESRIDILNSNHSWDFLIKHLYDILGENL